VNVYVDAGAVSKAAAAIEAIDEVTTVHVVTGEYDIIAQLSLEESNDLPWVVADEIHSVTGVVDTVTNVAFAP
jgi:anthranilate phosphoribosyltransferase